MMATLREPWDRPIRRAEQLAAEGGPAASLLAFYGRVLRAQKVLYDSLAGRRPSGSPQRDLPLIMGGGLPLLREVAGSGPDQLAAEARTLLDAADSTIANLLMMQWSAPSDCAFFAKAILQPYARWLADMAVAPIDRPVTPADNRCPFCGGLPQLSILDNVSQSTSADGGGRQLLCATCLTTWTFRRVLCACCGEEDEHKLGYFHSPALAHLRVDACDTCKRYLKTVDLTEVGIAVPLVDEVAGSSLDLWARDHGYEKIELNLLGL